MTLRFRAYAEVIDTWFYYEFDDEGWVTRQLELEGPEEEPIVAASRSELREALRAGRGKERRARFGWPGDQRFAEDDGAIPGRQDLTLEEFEVAWTRARERIRNRTPAPADDQERQSP